MSKQAFNTSVAKYHPCYETHPPLELAGHKIYGGNCSRPMVTNADIYIGFASSIDTHHYPWNSKSVSFYYPIQDMQAPKDPEDFKRMIEWLAVQLIANKVIHLGCVGGHGRTGTVLAALTNIVIGEEDAITYVRKHYCRKAVESASQVDFLHKHFGVKKVEATKTYDPAKTTVKPGVWNQHAHQLQANQFKSDTTIPPNLKLNIVPIKSQLCVWGPNIVFDKL